jgi:hypothetical protein
MSQHWRFATAEELHEMQSLSCSKACQSVHWTVHKQACKSPTDSESTTSTEGPFVLLLSLSNPDLLASTNEHFISALRSKVRVIQALDARKALQHLADTNLKSVFLADEGIIESKNSEVLSSLIGWVNAGGIAVVGSLFPSLTNRSEFDRFFKRWGLPWKMGNYHRTTFVLNPSVPQLSSHSANLTTSYSMKAVHLKGVKAEDILYAPAEDSRVESRVFAPSPVDLSHVPAAYTRIGDGFLGYIGDVNAEEESTGVILAMLRL